MRLYVNVDHVATVREARKTIEPDPVAAAVACLRAGADGITVHLREDRRHIQDDDVRRLARTGAMTLNLELATAPDVLDVVLGIGPHQATFVPERREEITTEGGLDVGGPGGPDPRLTDAVSALAGAGVRTSLFIDPDPASVDAAAAMGVDAVELHTGAFANAFPDADAPLRRLQDATRRARDAGLAVHAGHGLTYRNVTHVAAIAEIEELSIGHSIISRSILVGMETAVTEMRALLAAARVDQHHGTP